MLDVSNFPADIYYNHENSNDPCAVYGMGILFICPPWSQNIQEGRKFSKIGVYNVNKRLYNMFTM